MDNQIEARQILFRGKRIDNEEWIMGSYVKSTYYEGRVVHLIIKSESKYYGEGELSLVYEVIPETVGQCTGKKDRNNRQIFEGDIIMTHGDAQEAATVFYDDFCFGVDCNYCVLCVTDTDDIEVIGNIHDNPELLKSAGADAAQFADQPVLMSAT